MIWDPPREIFTIPYLNIPIVWYGVIFALGFAVSYYIFSYVLLRYLYNFPEFSEEMILDEALLIKKFTHPINIHVKLAVQEVSKKENLIKRFSKTRMIQALNRVIRDKSSYHTLDPIYKKKSVSHLFFYKNLAKPERAAVRIVLEKVFEPCLMTLKSLSLKITDRFSVYIIVATVVGARLGHLFFYESPSLYLENPWIIVQTWKGGLSSHGAALAILIAVYLFARWVKKWAKPLSFVKLLDLISIPAAFLGGCIRVGNFFNQEILGKPTKVFWAVRFGHPFDGSMPFVPRHPVQLYEAFFYFLTFGILSFLAYRTTIFLKKGRLIGLFFILVFTFRFFVEYFKVPQSAILNDSALTMGQILSIPMILLGIYFFRRKA